MQSNACLFVTEVTGIYQINPAATDSTGALPSKTTGYQIISYYFKNHYQKHKDTSE